MSCLRLQSGNYLLVTAATAMVLSACSPDAPKPDNADEPTTLEATERVAVVGGTQTGKALASGAGVSQQALNALTANIGALLWGASGGGASERSTVTLGTCPRVTLGGLLSPNGQDPSIQIDFGDEPCQPAGSAEICTGNAVGTFNQAQRKLDLTFNMIRCCGQTLSGSADLTFTLLRPGLKLSGDWDLVWDLGNGTMNIVGYGDISYVPVSNGCCDESRVQYFEGDIVHQGQSWKILCKSLKSSYEKYTSYVPFAGTIELQGADIRSLVIAFDENTPATGHIIVNISGFAPIDTTLYDMQEWIGLLAM